MNIIYKKQRGGKTTQLLELASKQEGYNLVVCNSHQDVKKFKEQFAEKRVHVLRIMPYFTYAVMAITYINTIFILMTTMKNSLMMIIQVSFIVLLTIAFIVMYKMDDKGDVLGLEFDYLFARNRPFKKMLKILERLEEDTRNKKRR